MKIFILIIVLKSGNANALSSVTAEFNSFESCEKALQSQIKQAEKVNYIFLVSAGCYEK